MNIAISGATGFIGSRLTKYLRDQGHTIYPLGRELFATQTIAPLMRVIEKVEVVINLAGSPIDRHWTRRHRESILESRVIVTRKIVQAINRSRGGRTLISASAVGYYPSVGCYDESSRVDNYTFLSYVCRLWEAEARKLKGSARLVITRLGVVYAHTSGVLPKIVATKNFGFLPRIGAMERPITWVDREDLIRALEFIAHNRDVEGVVNIVAPRFTLQRDFLEAAKERYNIGVVIPISPMILKLIYGRASEVIMQSQCVSSQILQELGFEYESEDIFTFFKRRGL
ncbi:MAG: NAD-dependent epimerase/dehydratase family protein [Rikenellaceae bacterium]